MYVLARENSLEEERNLYQWRKSSAMGPWLR